MLIQSCDCFAAKSDCICAKRAGSIDKAGHAAGEPAAGAIPGRFVSMPIQPSLIDLPAFAIDAIRASGESNWLVKFSALSARPETGRWGKSAHSKQAAILRRTIGAVNPCQTTPLPNHS